MSSKWNKTILVGSHNSHKIEEIQAILSSSYKVYSISTLKNVESPLETGSTFEANSQEKALYFSSFTDELVLADDSGLEVEALNGAPGIYSKRYSGKEGNSFQNNQKLLQELEGIANRTAWFRCAMTLAHKKKVLLTVEGICRGKITTELQGKNGFGYDPLFLYPPWNQTFGEISSSKKNQVSHRSLALNAFKEKLITIQSHNGVKNVTRRRK